MNVAEDIVYEILPAEQWEEAVPIIIDEFVTKGPLFSYCGTNREIFDGIFSKQGGLKGMIQAGVCLVARNGVGGKIVGINLFSYMKKEKSLYWSDCIAVTEKASHMLSFLMDLEADYDLFKEHPEIDYAYEHIFLAVLKDFSGKGIGTTLVRTSDQIAIKKNCKYVKVVVSGPVSYKIFSGHAYLTMKEVEYGSYEYKGKRVFPADMSGSTKAYFMVKKLQ